MSLQSTTAINAEPPNAESLIPKAAEPAKPDP